jgi:glycosyltransferase involved in cell wall biosynthesis
MTGKRVLFVAHSAFAGGAEFCLDTLLKNLTRSRYQITVLFPWEGPMAESARAMGYDVVVWPLNWWMCWGFSFWYFKTLLLRTLPNIFALARYIRQSRFDLVYSNTAVIFEAAVAASLARVPHVWHVHEVLRRGNITAPALPLKLVKRLIGCLSQRVIFESNASRDVYLDGQSDEHCAVVYNAVRIPASFSPADSIAARRTFGIGEGDRVVTFLGRFSERKNPLLVIRAAARLADRPGWRFLFAGDGPLRHELVRSIDHLGLARCCQVLPFQSDVTCVLNATDVLVLSSRQESFGLVLIEAAAHGKPAIATRSEGPCEIIVDGETGFLVDQDDDESLARTLTKFFGPDVDRTRLGQAASRRARNTFSAAEHARKIEDILDSALNGRDEPD